MRGSFLLRVFVALIFLVTLMESGSEAEVVRKEKKSVAGGMVRKTAGKKTKGKKSRAVAKKGKKSKKPKKSTRKSLGKILRRKTTGKSTKKTVGKKTGKTAKKTVGKKGKKSTRKTARKSTKKSTRRTAKKPTTKAGKKSTKKTAKKSKRKTGKETKKKGGKKKTTKKTTEITTTTITTTKKEDKVEDKPVKAEVEEFKDGSVVFLEEKSGERYTETQGEPVTTVQLYREDDGLHGVEVTRTPFTRVEVVKTRTENGTEIFDFPENVPIDPRDIITHLDETDIELLDKNIIFDRRGQTKYEVLTKDLEKLRRDGHYKRQRIETDEHFYDVLMEEDAMQVDEEDFLDEERLSRKSGVSLLYEKDGKRGYLYTTEKDGHEVTRLYVFDLGDGSQKVFVYKETIIEDDVKRDVYVRICQQNKQRRVRRGLEQSPFAYDGKTRGFLRVETSETSPLNRKGYLFRRDQYETDQSLEGKCPDSGHYTLLDSYSVEKPLKTTYTVQNKMREHDDDSGFFGSGRKDDYDDEDPKDCGPRDYMILEHETRGQEVEERPHDAHIKKMVYVKALDKEYLVTEKVFEGRSKRFHVPRDEYLTSGQEVMEEEYRPIVEAVKKIEAAKNNLKVLKTVKTPVYLKDHLKTYRVDEEIYDSRKKIFQDSLDRVAPQIEKQIVVSKRPVTETQQAKESVLVTKVTKTIKTKTTKFKFLEPFDEATGKFDLAKVFIHPSDVTAIALPKDAKKGTKSYTIKNAAEVTDAQGNPIKSQLIEGNTNQSSPYPVRRTSVEGLFTTIPEGKEISRFSNFQVVLPPGAKAVVATEVVTNEQVFGDWEKTNALAKYADGVTVHKEPVVVHVTGRQTDDEAIFDAIQQKSSQKRGGLLKRSVRKSEKMVAPKVTQKYSLRGKREIDDRTAKNFFTKKPDRISGREIKNFGYVSEPKHFIKQGDALTRGFVTEQQPQEESMEEAIPALIQQEIEQLERMPAEEISEELAIVQDAVRDELAIEGSIPDSLSPEDEEIQRLQSLLREQEEILRTQQIELGKISENESALSEETEVTQVAEETPMEVPASSVFVGKGEEIMAANSIEVVGEPVTEVEVVQEVVPVAVPSDVAGDAVIHLEGEDVIVVQSPGEAETVREFKSRSKSLSKRSRRRRYDDDEDTEEEDSRRSRSSSKRVARNPSVPQMK